MAMYKSAARKHHVTQNQRRWKQQYADETATMFWAGQSAMSTLFDPLSGNSERAKAAHTLSSIIGDYAPSGVRH